MEGRPSRKLNPGDIYTLDEIADHFGVDTHHLRYAGGIVSVPNFNSTLVFTDQSGDASFQYGDYWEGRTLIYAGKGQRGDQELKGQNRDVAENRRTLWLFEHVGPMRRRFLGNPVCRRYWMGAGEDKEGRQRRVLRFALELQNGDALPLPPESVVRKPAIRTPRAFDESKKPARPRPGQRSISPEQWVQMIEKATAGHHQILCKLKRELDALGWTDIEEIPSAIDLRARRGQKRVIFEAKTISPGQECPQMRCALSQLLEYRFFYGEPTTNCAS